MKSTARKSAGRSNVSPVSLTDRTRWTANMPDLAHTVAIAEGVPAVVD